MAFSSNRETTIFNTQTGDICTPPKRVLLMAQNSPQHPVVLCKWSSHFQVTIYPKRSKTTKNVVNKNLLALLSWHHPCPSSQHILLTTPNAHFLPLYTGKRFCYHLSTYLSELFVQDRQALKTLF